MPGCSGEEGGEGFLYAGLILDPRGDFWRFLGGMVRYRSYWGNGREGGGWLVLWSRRFMRKLFSA